MDRKARRTAARFSLGRAEATGPGRFATTAVESVDMVSPKSAGACRGSLMKIPVAVMLYRCYAHYMRIADPL